MAAPARSHLNDAAVHSIRRTKSYVLWTVLCAYIVPIFLWTSSVDGDWLVGISRADVTPTEPLWLSGLASRTRIPTAEEVGSSDPLFVTALTLHHSEDPLNRLVLVSLDLIGSDANFSDAVFARLHSEYGLERRSVRLCFSHTHSGPVVGRNLFPLYPDDAEFVSAAEEYVARLEDAIVRTVGEAFAPEKLQKVYPRFGVAKSDLAVNRIQISEKTFDGICRGDTDDSIPVLWFERVSTQDQVGTKPSPFVVGGIFGYAAHPTVITSGYSYSGDFPRYACDRLESETGPGGLWLFVSGAGGDQNVYPRGSKSHAIRVGESLASSVAHAVQKRGRKVRHLRKQAIETVHQFTPLQFRVQRSRRELRRLQRSGSVTEKRMARHWARVLEASGEETTARHYMRFPIAGWRIGDLRILFLGGEATVAYSLLLGSGSRRFDWVISYADDVMAYVGTSSMLRAGKDREGSDRSAIYYGLPSTWAPEVEEVIRNESLRILKLFR